MTKANPIDVITDQYMRTIAQLSARAAHMAVELDSANAQVEALRAQVAELTPKAESPQ